MHVKSTLLIVLQQEIGIWKIISKTTFIFVQLCYFWGTGCASIQFVAYAISIEGTKAPSQTENTLNTM